ncbi:MAG: DUF3857 domain-containing protein [Bacteroidota bacterium]|nr:DUF3857 domain-containing protein [Bacteroidota bacterium]MDP4254689.1 DUF3857 domain-containing protein [Bacteroidota bacterium]
MSQLQRKTFFLWMSCMMAGQSFLFAQDKSPVKFGKITPADFNLPQQKFDSGAEAVVIADIGSSAFLGDTKGWFSLEFRHFKRIRIISKAGMAAATVEIPLYGSGSEEERATNIKAVTYNLENGKVVETKLEDKSIFTEKMSKKWTTKKFTLPAVKEGSIVEYSYIQTSPFFENLQPWEFQAEYPCLWSEYEVNLPEFFDYVFLGQGYLKYDIDTTIMTKDTYRIIFPGGSDRDEVGMLPANVVSRRWVAKNVPALKEENYTTTIRNHIQRIEFQLSQYRFPQVPVRNMMGNWFLVSEKLLADDDFGADLDKSNSWMNDSIRIITEGASTPMGKARKIYEYVRDHFVCTSHNARLTDNPIRTVFKNKNGNEASINLLLTAMLRHEGIETDPVLLSTREHGYAPETYPLLERYNYVICRVRIDSVVYLLDASQPWLGFGRLPGYCYNGRARVINKEMPVIVDLNADSVTEGKSTMVFIFNDEKGGLSGTYLSTPGYFESSAVRQKLRDKGEKDFFTSVQSEYTGGIKITNTEIDSVKMPDFPIKIAYNLSIPHDSTEDIIYFSPILAPEVYKDNPFKAATRSYPVEIPYAMDETYTLNMEVPKGYAVEEMPKSTRVLFNSDEGYFEYIIQKDDDNIQMRSRIKLLKANFKPEDYSVLRDFFAFVVKKQSEQFVFKKKK